MEMTAVRTFAFICVHLPSCGDLLRIITLFEHDRSIVPNTLKMNQFVRLSCLFFTCVRFSSAYVFYISTPHLHVVRLNYKYALTPLQKHSRLIFIRGVDNKVSWQTATVGVLYINYLSQIVIT